MRGFGRRKTPTGAMQHKDVHVHCGQASSLCRERLGQPCTKSRVPGARLLSQPSICSFFLRFNYCSHPGSSRSRGLQPQGTAAHAWLGSSKSQLQRKYLLLLCRYLRASPPNITPGGCEGQKLPGLWGNHGRVQGDAVLWAAKQQDALNPNLHHPDSLLGALGVCVHTQRTVGRHQGCQVVFNGAG